MLPSATPMILLHRLGADGRRATDLSAVFVMATSRVGAVGTSCGAVWPSSRPHAQHTAVAVAALLILAGVYQSPAKSTCLRLCRTPADFLFTHWHRVLRAAAPGGRARPLLPRLLLSLMRSLGVGAMSLVWRGNRPARACEKSPARSRVRGIAVRCFSSQVRSFSFARISRCPSTDVRRKRWLTEGPA